MIDRKCSNDRKIEEQIRLVVDIVGGDREAAGRADHMALIGKQRECGHHCHCRNDNARFRTGRTASADELFDRPECNS